MPPSTLRTKRARVEAKPMTEQVEWITIDERFCGPPRSGNGGYVCGRVAEGIDGPVAVRLKAPPPIGRRLRLERGRDAARLIDPETLDAEGVVAEARREAFELAPPPPPSLADARAAEARFLGLVEHNFPTCFVCGPARRAGDGLRIFPGRLDPDSPASESILAATWTPDRSLADERGQVRSEFVWAALDCPGAFTRYPLASGVALVLGEMAVERYDRLAPETTCIVTAWSLGDAGRRRSAATALHRSDGSLVAKARAIWIEVPASTWR